MLELILQIDVAVREQAFGDQKVVRLVALRTRGARQSTPNEKEEDKRHDSCMKRADARQPRHKPGSADGE